MNDQSETVRRTFLGGTNLPVVYGSAGCGQGGSRTGSGRIDSGFAAQVFGAAGQRRGLKGGAPVLQAARRAYLETEWSGHGDRRVGVGALAARRI